MRFQKSIMATLARLTISRLLLNRWTPGPVASSSSRAMSQAWQQQGIVGSNLPFRINNRYLLTFYFIVFFAVPFNLPFLVVAHQLRKR